MNSFNTVLKHTLLKTRLITCKQQIVWNNVITYMYIPNCSNKSQERHQPSLTI